MAGDLPQAGGAVIDMSNVQKQVCTTDIYPCNFEWADVVAAIKGGATIAVAARQVGVSEKTLYRHARARGVCLGDLRTAQEKPFKIDISYVVDEMRQGKTVVQLAHQLGVCRSAIYKRAAQARIDLAELSREGRAVRRVAKAAAVQEVYAAPAATISVAPARGDDLAQGYIAGLIATGGKYGALDEWRARYSTADRPITAARALQEWHKYRGTR